MGSGLRRSPIRGTVRRFRLVLILLINMIQLYHHKEEVCCQMQIQIQLDTQSGRAIYQQIVDALVDAIDSGRLVQGYKLPTVRQFADEIGAAKGTVQHAYDSLEREGYITKIQGSGSFVNERRPASGTSKKTQAMSAIDRMLDQMEALGFSCDDTRIFIELKLRERERRMRDVLVAAVDCSPEALSVIKEQLLALPDVDVREYLLNDVVDTPQIINEEIDIIITTNTHYKDVDAALGRSKRILQMVMAVAPGTAADLARVTRRSVVGILCASERYSAIIRQACERYCVLESPPLSRLFGAEGSLSAWLEGLDTLVLPTNYLRFCTAEEQREILRYQQKKTPIVYHYQIEKGSLLYADEEISKMRRELRQHL